MKNDTMVWESFLVFVSKVFEVNSLHTRIKTLNNQYNKV